MNTKENDGLGDWRIQAATRLTKDVPAAYPGGPSHKAGASVFLTTATRDSSGNNIGFITPCPTALALSIATNASNQGVELRKTLAFKDVITPWGSGKNVAIENIPHLYNYFEQCMVTISFSFQALETFSNDIIANKLKGTYQYKKNKPVLDVSSDDLQKIASTEEKLAMILPTILGCESPKGKKIWQDFKDLKNARDSTIHLKSYEAYNREIDKESLFYQFFRLDINKYPKFAFELIKYFIVPKQTPRWFELARNQIFCD